MTDLVHVARLELPCASEAVAAVVMDAVVVELDEGPEGSTCQADRNGAVIRMVLEARDVSTLRAALNGVVRLVETAHRVAAPS